MDLLLKSVGKIEINDVVTWPYILPLDFVDAMCHYPFKNWRKRETLRLCLIRVKTFPENISFSEMLFFGKENVFMCLVAFQKIFQKIFSGVWKRRRKRQTQKNTDKTQKKNHQRSTLDWVRRRGALRALV